MKNRIKKLRKSLDMTQADFSSKIGLSRNFIAQIETGAKVPSNRTISDICREFNVREEWLRNGEEPMNPDSDIEFADLCFQIGLKDERARAVLEKYLKLNEEDKKLFMNLLERLAKRAEG